MYNGISVYIYNNSNKIQKIPKCSQKLYQQYEAWTPSSAPISGVNLHIVKEGDKLQELSRVPTCHTNINAIWMSYSYHFKILFFSFFSKQFTTMHLDSFYSYMFFIS